MCNTSLKKQLVEIGDQLALILSKDKENFMLYKIAKQLYVINQRLLEISDEGLRTDGYIESIVDDCTESVAEHRLLDLENSSKRLDYNINELKKSMGTVSETVYSHERLLKPIDNLLKKHSECIESIKKTLSYIKE